MQPNKIVLYFHKSSYIMDTIIYYFEMFLSFVIVEQKLIRINNYHSSNKQNELNYQWRIN